MFTSIRHRLLLSYLGVLSAVLTVFAIAVRFTFAHNLNQQLIARLETLATAAALELELDGGELNVDLENITNANQAVQFKSGITEILIMVI
ncbi:MAG: HAMP domain-containing histidine kinase [Chloroflexi bacterium AL-N10]|nr:HAMP domain-containing histidine kinase [Chloroflexi bacterium AL-N10]NOK92746.1 HAMP domain-containing histidine kinase [Chloroflexi bacterium AL-N15]